MAVRPPLPDTFSLPSVVNGWLYDDEASWNAHVWTAPNAPQSVAVFDYFDEVAVKVIDDRVQGFQNRVLVATVDAVGNDRSTDVVRAIEKTIDWMEVTPPGTWRHPDVNEAVFDPPPGYELTHYYIESREVIVYYHRKGAHEGRRLASIDSPNDPEVTPETYPYLVVKTWRGSGNATVALAPWDYAHDTEMVDVRDPPDECGLDIALTIARDYAADATGEDSDPLAIGQTDLTVWSE
jgi:hypothetical protein